MSPFDFDEDVKIPYPKDFLGMLKEKAPRTAMTLAALQAADPSVKYARGVIRGRKTFTVRVRGGIHSSDGLYDELHAWVLSQLPPQDRKAVIAYAVPAARSFLDHQAPPPPRVRLRYDGNRAQVITVRGYPVKTNASEGGAGADGKQVTSPEICFTMGSPAARDAFLLEIEEILRASALKSRPPVSRMLDKWNDWMLLDTLSLRPLESVVLPRGQLPRIISDIQRFLDSEGDYNRRCIPWHRGHFYHGEAGTGKTSTAQALASYFALDMWYLPLSDIKRDSDLIQKISGIRGKSILLLEDIDVFSAAEQRKEEKKHHPGGSTLSGLLNALDGIATPHGLITIMTANHPEVLDKALLRTGRVDLEEHFTLSGHEEAERLIARWFDLPSSPHIRKDLEMSASDISEICKRNDSAAATVREINESTEEKLLSLRARDCLHILRGDRGIDRGDTAARERLELECLTREHSSILDAALLVRQKERLIHGTAP